MISKELSNWESYIKNSFFDTDSTIVVLLSEKGKLLYSNEAFKNTIPHFSIQKLLNPTFEKIKSLKFIEDRLIFNDFITLGSYSSNSNLSFKAYIYKNEDQFLIVGQQAADKLTEQNRKLNEMLRENNDLQRQLLKKTRSLENTLNELDKVNIELKKQIQTKDKIFSIIAHDLRSPFNGILGFAEILKENLPDLQKDEIEKFVDHIYNASHSYYNLIINLLDWASLQQKKYSFLPRKNNIKQLVSEVLIVLSGNAIKKDINVQINIPDDLDFCIDRNMFSAILRNLLSNAIKFTQPKGEITIKGDIEKNHLVITIQDSGIGISKERIKNILSNEFIESTNGTADEKGTGLGLSLCREFIEIHGGNLSVKSKIHEGTSFIVSIPDINKN